MSSVVTWVVIALAVVGAITVWAGFSRWWGRRSNETRSLLIELLLLPVAFVMLAVVVGIGLLALDWVLRTLTSWGGINDNTLIILALIASGLFCAGAVFNDLANFALERERAAERRRTDPEWDALMDSLERTLGEDELSRFTRAFQQVFVYFPGLLDDMEAAIAWEELEAVLQPHPRLRRRFMAQVRPKYEARMEAYIYGPPPGPGVRQRAGAIRRMIARQPAPENATPSGHA